MRIVVSSPVYATEDMERVEQATKAFFPGEVERAADAVRVTCTNPEPLRQRIWELRIIDTFRGQAEAKMRELETEFHLDKQAAVAERISFPVGQQPLGTIHVHCTVEPGDPWKDAEEFVWWLCPPTKDGQIVE